MNVKAMPARLFGQPLVFTSDSIGASLSRAYSDAFSFYDARLGELPSGRFIAAVAKERPTVLLSRSVAHAVKRLGEDRPVVVCWDGIDSGMKRALAGEGIAYIRDYENCFLPFVGAMSSDTPPLRQPAPLSPQAQRIALNVMVGRWAGKSAGELARLCGRSNASVTKYLAEVEAVLPGSVRSEGRAKTVSLPRGIDRAGALDVLEAYLSSPVKESHRLPNGVDVGLLAEAGARLSGISALAALTDLAMDTGHLVVAVDAGGLKNLREAFGGTWPKEAEWYDDWAIEVEVWAYPTREVGTQGIVAAGLECVDECSLFAEVTSAGYEGVREVDAIDQLREAICHM